MEKEKLLAGTDAAYARINTAREILEVIRKQQAVDGSPDFPDGISEEADAMMPLLCEAGLIREITVTEGGFRFRITWKGLCFLDTAYFFAAAHKFIEDDQDARVWIATLAATTFH